MEEAGADFLQRLSNENEQMSIWGNMEEGEEWRREGAVKNSQRYGLYIDQSHQHDGPRMREKDGSMYPDIGGGTSIREWRKSRSRETTGLESWSGKRMGGSVSK